MIDILLKYWPVLVVAGSFISTWVSWSAKKHFVSHADLGEVRTTMGTRMGGIEDKVSQLELDATRQINDLEKDVAVIKTRLDSMPTKDDLHRIEAAVLEVSGSVQGVAASQKAIERNLHLIVKAKIEE